MTKIISTVWYTIGMNDDHSQAATRTYRGTAIASVTLAILAFCGLSLLAGWMIWNLASNPADNWTSWSVPGALILSCIGLAIAIATFAISVAYLRGRLKSNYLLVGAMVGIYITLIGGPVMTAGMLGIVSMQNYARSQQLGDAYEYMKSERTFAYKTIAQQVEAFNAGYEQIVPGQTTREQVDDLLGGSHAEHVSIEEKIAAQLGANEVRAYWGPGYKAWALGVTPRIIYYRDGTVVQKKLQEDQR